jgi:hypothetical protein
LRTFGKKKSVETITAKLLDTVAELERHAARAADHAVRRLWRPRSPRRRTRPST